MYINLNYSSNSFVGVNLLSFVYFLRFLTIAIYCGFNYLCGYQFKYWDLNNFTRVNLRLISKSYTFSNLISYIDLFTIVHSSIVDKLQSDK